MSDSAGVARTIVLIGPMGAGKSRVGARLAAELGVPFVDTDQRIVELHGPIPDIFERSGEATFRELERDIVVAAVHEPGVVALGGGAVLHPDTRSALEALEDLAVVLLRVDASVVAGRLAGGGRPLLADGGVERWTQILAEREPVYTALADIEVDTSRRPVARIVEEITGRLGASA